MVRYQVSFFIKPCHFLIIIVHIPHFPNMDPCHKYCRESRPTPNKQKNVIIKSTALYHTTYRWDELGGYDIPASLRFILSKTGFKKLSYIGHSLGTGIFFIAMIRHPELNQHIHKMIALAPITSKFNLRSPFRFVAPIIQPLAV